MPILAQLEEKDVCWYDHEFAFGESEVRFVFDTALKKVSDVGFGECGGRAEVYADTVFGAVCEERVDLADGGGGDFPGEGGEVVRAGNEVGVEEPEDADELCDA